jgi:hypothetical protein
VHVLTGTRNNVVEGWRLEVQNRCTSLQAENELCSAWIDVETSFLRDDVEQPFLRHRDLD